jgi:hypothetical protein
MINIKKLIAGFLFLFAVVFFGFETAHAQTCANPTNTIIAGRAVKMDLSNSNGAKTYVGVPNQAIFINSANFTDVHEVQTDSQGYFYKDGLGTCKTYNVFYVHSQSNDNSIHYHQSPENGYVVSTGEADPPPHWLQIVLTPYN